MIATDQLVAPIHEISERLGGGFDLFGFGHGDVCQSASKILDAD
jgi:hypothetical protein